MILRTIISFMALLFATHVIGQTRTLTGRVIDEEFNLFPLVSIFNADTVLLAKADLNGDFSISIPLGTKALIFASVGTEWKEIDLLSDCNNLEIILQSRSTYDFMTPAKVDRLRKKQFDKLSVVHRLAFKKDIFKTDKPCYIDKFISCKKEVIKRHKASKRRDSN